MVTYAGIIVDISHSKLDKVFQYRIPEALIGRVRPGTRVSFPFGQGNRMQTGYVIEISHRPQIDPDRIKEIAAVDEGGTRIESELIALAAWIRSRYGGTMNQALKTVLPVREKKKEKEERRILLAVDHTRAVLALDQLKARRQEARKRLLEGLLQSPDHSLDYKEAIRRLKLSASVVRAMEEMGLVKIDRTRVYRNPIESIRQAQSSKTGGTWQGSPAKEELCPDPQGSQPAAGIRLSPAQDQVVKGIIQKRLQGDTRPSLLFGVTGSGKTEVYMELIADAIKRGQQSIVLIPEIALTYQTLSRFYARFGSRVSVLHSKMSAGERYDQFERAKEGLLDVMIGPRSALFTPFARLGYIIIDEEHEASYKSEGVPRYHACEVALCRARMHGASLVLGSATPSLASYTNAKEGLWHLYRMPDRISGRPLPKVYTVDLKQELRSGNRSVFSRTLRGLMEDRLARGEQTMLFLNRRGMAGFVSCRSCGQVIKCRHCDVSMTLHKDAKLHCHYCGATQDMPKKCPACGSPHIGSFRAGTQQIEDRLRKEFPGARILRMDADSTRKKDGYEQILSAFANREADILIGTQMIVKGHDFPAVTLVGVLAADLSLYVPDYRAAERTFSLLTQAAGRAGRGNRPGEVVIQTYQPDHYSITTAAAQDYPAFYEQEMLYRKLLHYPPAWDMMLLHIDSPVEELADRTARQIGREIDRFFSEENKRLWQMIGPSDAGIARIGDVYKKVIYVKHSRDERLTEMKSFLEEGLLSEPIPRVSVQFNRNPL